MDKTHYTYTMEIEIPQDIYDTLITAFETHDTEQLYNGIFEDWLHDMANFRILRHILKNVELHMDLEKHYRNLQQT